jgi:hypothetical protein
MCVYVHLLYMHMQQEKNDYHLSCNIILAVLYDAYASSD